MIIRKNILITGPPRIGKSTLIEKIMGRLQKPLTGFFTREIKQKRRRVGFSIVTLDGKTGLLAHQDIRGKPRVGKYGVDIEQVDKLAVPSIRPASPDTIVVIDEIGKMECFSLLFCEALVQVLSSQNPVIASIALHGPPFIKDIKARNDILLIEVTEKNRNKLTDEILLLLNTLPFKENHL
ncbi:MAG: NTPase [Deltaproteobacteria bacterium]|nr:NTPase [Deltaproteobacteria bacterium]